MDVREKLVEFLSQYFDIGDSYAYNLTRVKSAFACGTMGFDDFEEFDEETVEDIADHLIAHGVTVQDNTEISDELLERLRNAPITAMTQEPTVEVVQEWISVKDRLPEDGQNVLTCKNGICEIQTYDKRRNGWLCNGWFWSMATVTYWMPMPQPPKGE